MLSHEVVFRITNKVATRGTRVSPSLVPLSVCGSFKFSGTLGGRPLTTSDVALVMIALYVAHGHAPSLS